MEYKINENIEYFMPDTVILTYDNRDITVSMAQDIIEYILQHIAAKSHLGYQYEKARSALSKVKLILNNEPAPKVTKEEAKFAIDELKEFLNLQTASQKEKEYNEYCALICKLFIDMSMH